MYVKEEEMFEAKELNLKETFSCTCSISKDCGEDVNDIIWKGEALTSYGPSPGTKTSGGGALSPPAGRPALRTPFQRLVCCGGAGATLWSKKNTAL